MANPFFDVIIIGGGPAATSCALFLRKLNPGLSVCLVERSAFPKTKTCGDGISPQVVDIIHQAGIADFFENRLPVSSFVLTMGESAKIRYDLRNLSVNRSDGYVYPREEFDTRLFRQAMKRGVITFEQHDIREITDIGPCHTMVSGKSPTGSFELAGKIIVGADGAHSMLRRHLKIPPNPAKHMGVGIRYYANTTLKDLSLRIDILPQLRNSYGWLFPVSENVVNVGIGADVSVYKKDKLDLQSEFDKYVQFLGKEISLQPLANSKASFALPYGSRMPELVHGNKVLIGDAASMINPLTGEGIYYGMSAGKLLAEHLAPAFATDSEPDKLLPAFAKEYENKFRKHYRFNYRIKRLLNTSFSGFLVKALCKDQVLMDRAVRRILDNVDSRSQGQYFLSTVKYSTKKLYEQFKRNVSWQ